MNAYKKRGIPLQGCKRCGTAFPKELNVCPNCGFDRRDFIKRASWVPDGIYKRLTGTKTQRRATHKIPEGSSFRSGSEYSCDYCSGCVNGRCIWCD